MSKSRSFMVFHRGEGELKLTFFDSLFDNVNSLEWWLNTPVEKGGGLGLWDVMSGNGIRSTENSDILYMLSGGENSCFPENSFLVVEGKPLEMFAHKQVVSYSVPN